MKLCVMDFVEVTPVGIDKQRCWAAVNPVTLAGRWFAQGTQRIVKNNDEF